jgi:hypothetical protein
MPPARFQKPHPHRKGNIGDSVFNLARRTIAIWGMFTSTTVPVFCSDWYHEAREGMLTA